MWGLSHWLAAILVLNSSWVEELKQIPHSPWWPYKTDKSVHLDNIHHELDSRCRNIMRVRKHECVFVLAFGQTALRPCKMM